jgi:hypothetical protein
MIKSMGDSDNEEDKPIEAKQEPVKITQLLKSNSFEAKLGRFYKDYEVIM